MWLMSELDVDSSLGLLTGSEPELGLKLVEYGRRILACFHDGTRYSLHRVLR